MEILMYSFIAISNFCGIYAWRKTRDIFHPAFLVNLFFTIPVFFSSLKLSNLQSEDWDSISYLIIIYAILAFVVLPTLLIRKRIVNRLAYHKNFLFPKAILFLFSAISIITYFVVTKIITGSFLPIFNVNSSHHNSSVDILSTVSNVLVTFTLVMNFFKYKDTKNKIFLVMSLILLLLPLTRLARFDMFTNLIILCAIAYDLSINRKKYLIGFLVTAPLILLLWSGIGEYRMTQGYKYDVTYAKEIQYNSYSGPFDSLAVLYGYSALSVENLDRFVEKNETFNQYTLGAYTLRPVLVGLFKAHRLIGHYPMFEYFNSLRDPLTNSATVPTAIPEFTLDFGYYFSIIPMLLYSLLGIFLYLKSQQREIYRPMYLTFVQCYALMSFVNVFFQPFWLYQIILLTSANLILYRFYKKCGDYNERKSIYTISNV